MNHIELLQAASTLHQEGKASKALDAVYDYVDGFLLDGELAEVREILRVAAAVQSLPITLLLGLLTITFTRREELGEPRQALFQSTAHQAVNQFGLFSAAALLSGLE